MEYKVEGTLTVAFSLVKQSNDVEALLGDMFYDRDVSGISLIMKNGETLQLPVRDITVTVDNIIEEDEE